jgi:aquaporin Z
MVEAFNLVNYFVEFIATFIFLSVIIINGSPIAISVALLAMLYFSGNITGGHINPAITAMFYMKGELSMCDSIFYIGSQVLGAAAAYYFYIKIYLPNKKN